MDGLREVDKRSRHFLLGDQFSNSHNLISGQSMDMGSEKIDVGHHWDLKGCAHFDQGKNCSHMDGTLIHLHVF